MKTLLSYNIIQYACGTLIQYPPQKGKRKDFDLLCQTMKKQKEPVIWDLSHRQ